MRMRAGPRVRLIHHHPTESTPLVPPQRSSTWPQIWSFAYPYVIPSTIRLRLLAALALTMVVLRKLVALVPPYAFKLAVDSLTNSNPSQPILVPFHAILVYALARIAVSLFTMLQDFCFLNVSVDVTKRFSTDIFNHLQNLSLAFHLQRKTGEITRIMDRGMSSIETLSNTVIFTLMPTFLESLLVTTIFVHLGTPAIAISTFVTVAAYFIFTIVFTGWRMKLRRLYIEADNNVSSKAVDSLMNYETVKMFGMEREEVLTYSTLMDVYQKVFIRLRMTLSSLNFGQSAIQVFGQGAAIIFAAYATANGRLTVGDFVMINSYVLQMFQPLFFLGSSYRQLTQASTDLEKCFNLFQEKITVQDASDAQNMVISESDVLAGTAGEVCFHNVSFKYAGNERGAKGGLRNISFRISPGKMIAFVGASGTSNLPYFLPWPSQLYCQLQSLTHLLLLLVTSCPVTMNASIANRSREKVCQVPAFYFNIM